MSIRALEGSRYRCIEEVWRDLLRYQDEPETVAQIVRNAAVVRWGIRRGDA
ncbi:hypothetical protein ACQEVX_30415 [Streptomyces syringium]|uniref:hypothetical protein n=1 Tax=Streptomyces syringium TaxID=76729 RepID=UPI003D8C4304